jgi:hypothetical protein
MVSWTRSMIFVVSGFFFQISKKPTFRLWVKKAPITSLGIYIYIYIHLLKYTWEKFGYLVREETKDLLLNIASIKIFTQISCCILLSTANTRKMLCRHGY